MAHELCCMGVRACCRSDVAFAVIRVTCDHKAEDQGDGHKGRHRVQRFPDVVRGYVVGLQFEKTVDALRYIDVLG